MIIADHQKKYNESKSSQEKIDAILSLNTALNTFGKLTIGAVGVIAIVSAISPISGAVLVAMGLSAGVIGLGQHISATFSSKELTLWDRIRGTPNKPDQNHPDYARLKEYQNQYLQIALKRMANANGRAEITGDDLARVAVLADKDFQQTFYSSPATQGEQLRPGLFKSELKAKEYEAYERLADMTEAIRDIPDKSISMDAHAKLNYQAAKVQTIKSILSGFQGNFGEPINFSNRQVWSIRAKAGRLLPDNYSGEYFNLTYGQTGKYTGENSYGNALASLSSTWPVAGTSFAAIAGSVRVNVDGALQKYDDKPFYFSGTAEQWASFKMSGGTVQTSIWKGNPTIVVKMHSEGTPADIESYCFDSVETYSVNPDWSLRKIDGSTLPTPPKDQLGGGSIFQTFQDRAASVSSSAGSVNTSISPWLTFGSNPYSPSSKCAISKWNDGCPCTLDPSGPGC